MTTDLAIEAVGLAKSYGSTSVLDHFDLRVPRGGVFALLGPNGAGKTTTVRILATLTRADAGRIRVAGHDVGTQRREVRRRISLTGQYAALDEAQTGEENLRMMGRLLHLAPRLARRRAAELLERFDLTDAGRRRVETYSGGMRRRLDLAAGLVGEPEIIFLDEPTTGLDPRSRAAMWEIVAELATGGRTVFLTTQYLDEADRLADRIAVVDGGRVVADGTAAQLKEQVGGRRLDVALAATAGPEAFATVVRRLGPRAVTADPARRTVGIATDGTAAHVRALLDEIDAGRDRVAHFDVHTTTLDDVFLALTARPAPAEVRPIATENPIATEKRSEHV
ncbi:ATP-binding cassette domain-containing protein [Frankia sp. AiPs1]|uniref:ATP-binding cassette domain-containing protein n=1 Tax=Frankia sp. AiPs1 TaxID=573493 RepID=UPI002044383D|nr:ATP-binding cassette domain-containing protein [Frankia sp. AiPs1]MCM3921048.1 ATP-binding cassette domain-containing protein [Frankia sp. AiPs1]